MEEVFEVLIGLAVPAIAVFSAVYKLTQKNNKQTPARPPVIAPEDILQDEDIDDAYEDEYRDQPFYEAVFTEHIVEPIDSLEGRVASMEGIEPEDHDHGESLLKSDAQPIAESAFEQPTRSEWQRAMVLTEILGKPVSRKGRINR